MKTFLVLAALILPSLAHAAQEQVFCGFGKETGTIEGSQLAFTLQDGNAKIFIQGRDDSSLYSFSPVAEGTLASPADKNFPEIIFGRCNSMNVAGAHFVGGEVSNQTFLCNCTAN